MLRRKVPSVEGAITLWGRTALVAPLRGTSQSLIESAPTNAAWIKVIAFCSGGAAQGRKQSFTIWVTSENQSVRLLSR